MADSIQIPQSLIDLGEVIRTIERESGQPSQLVVIVGEDKYIVGNLTKRAGEYLLEMQDKYDPDQLKRGFKRGEEVENPHKNLAGSYDTFEALIEAVKKTQEQPAVYLIGSPENGYSVAVRGISLGSAGGRTYITIGRIFFPLLQDREKVSIDRI